MAMEIEALGGEVNAYTTFDHTNYYVTAASASAGQALDILADAVVEATFDPAELAKEKEVVIEEIRMNQNNPARRKGWEVFAQAFGDSPTGGPSSAPSPRCGASPARTSWTTGPAGTAPPTCWWWRWAISRPPRSCP